MTRSALLVGATGLVGGQLLARLLRDPRYDRVTVLARRPLGLEHPRLDARVVDFAKLGADDLPAGPGETDVYGALGTTIRQAGSQEAFRDVDQHHTVRVAELARTSGATRIAVVSSVGAGSGSRAFYLRVKGDMEAEVTALGYPQTEFFRPSFILGRRPSHRRGEGLGSSAATVLAPLLAGPARPYRPVPAGRLAAAMIAALTEDRPGVRVRTYDDFLALAPEPVAADQA
ncbi:NAD(P)H-binding protein [Streptomyces sp. NBC_00091]|uniref:NAD(P)H-binding protein n=1 Tax=Streptomyces sp. NBC_00091 TaxID=2975648 RepID=UPI0022553686|nr:NAD(P)H-binding protein [Streptomyces sp. NBC_00091]MCX5380285.1 NAD(P)H-binding protein [Streptomyces sp. NBC_00091]